MLRQLREYGVGLQVFGQAAANPALRNAKVLCPLGNAFRLAAPLQATVISFIASVLLACSPPAILWPVAPAVVNAVNLVVHSGRLSHIRQETLKRVAPLLADLDAAAAISWKRLVCLIGAPADEVVPNGINPCFSHSMLSHGCAHAGGCGSLCTAATGGVSSFSVVPFDPEHVAAVALAKIEIPHPLCAV
jgi:hypothetical protein